MLDSFFPNLALAFLLFDCVTGREPQQCLSFVCLENFGFEDTLRA